MSELEQIADIIRDNFEEVNTARDRAYQRSRQLTSICARAIRRTHNATRPQLCHQLRVQLE